MSMQTSIRAEYGETIFALVGREDFVRATFAGAARWETASSLHRVAVRRVLLRGGIKLQVSRFTERQDVTRNYPLVLAGEALADVLAVGFSNVHVTTAAEEIDLRLSKKGELHVGRRKRAASETLAPEAHNRTKTLPLPEGRADRVLEVMGIMTAEGAVRPTMRAKFTQINEFLKLLDPVLPAAGAGEGHGRALEILDCGCGSSYLTIAAHHYLNEVKGIPARVLGVDINEELVRKSAERSTALEMPTLTFAAGRIGSLNDVHPDIVLALHACDTATDDAIVQAVRSGARALLAVPCCHKHLNSVLNVPAMKPLHRHGILHQRFADLVTDTFRALVLRVMGYRAEVIEFISPEHTARNLMIRAVRTGQAGNAAAMAEYRAFKAFTGVTPYLEEALGEQWAGALWEHGG